MATETIQINSWNKKNKKAKKNIKWKIVMILTGIDPYRSPGRQKDRLLGLLESVIIAEFDVAAIAREHAVEVRADRTDDFRLRVGVALNTAATSRVWSGREVHKQGRISMRGWEVYFFLLLFRAVVVFSCLIWWFGLMVRFWVVYTLTVSRTLILTTTLSIILPRP